MTSRNKEIIVWTYEKLHSEYYGRHFDADFRVSRSLKRGSSYGHLSRIPVIYQHLLSRTCCPTSSLRQNGGIWELAWTSSSINVSREKVIYSEDDCECCSKGSHRIRRLIKRCGRILRTKGRTMMYSPKCQNTFVFLSPASRNRPATITIRGKVSTTKNEDESKFVRGPFFCT